METGGAASRQIPADARVQTAGHSSRSASESGDPRTRDRVTQLLMELGPCTAVELSERLGLSAAGVRRHLDAMCASGAISASVVPSPRPGQRGRGRPAKRYALTAAGHAAGPAAYDELAVSALGFLTEHCGTEAINEFARSRAQQLASRVVARLDTDGVPDVEQLAGALTAEGYSATVHPVATGTQLCQHHCPVQSVAAHFPQLCEAETEALSQLLDTHVQRLATIAHGDGVCTTHVPAASGRTSLNLAPESAANNHRKVSP